MQNNTTREVFIGHVEALEARRSRKTELVLLVLGILAGIIISRLV